MKIRFNRFLTAVILSVGVVFSGFAPAVNAQDIQVPVAPRHIEAAAPQQAAFNGPALYKAAFESIRDNHMLLADPAARAKWVAEWEKKFDGTDKLKTEAGTDDALKQLNASLGQRFDYFMDVEATTAEKQSQSSTLVGIGTTLKLTNIDAIFKALPKGATMADFERAQIVGPNHQLLIEEPMEGSPAIAVLKPGDIIIGVDAKVGPDGKVINNVDGRTQKEIVDTIRGQANTSVKITVLRGGVEHTFDIVRKPFIVKVVTTKDLGNGVSYIRLSNFMSQNATREMHDALKAAAKGKAIVIDLRGNPGGSLNAVLIMSAFLMPEGKVLSTLNRDGDKITQNDITLTPDFVQYFTPPLSPTNLPSVDQRPPLLIPADMPIVVLIDEDSASASEILSGALQHNHRAVIVGKPSHGKGVGQNVIDLPFGRRLHVTSFEFRPGGDKMDWIGIVPDVIVERDSTGNTDTQLDAATAKANELVKAAADLAKVREDLRKAKEDEFKKSQTP